MPYYYIFNRTRKYSVEIFNTIFPLKYSHEIFDGKIKN